MRIVRSTPIGSESRTASVASETVLAVVPCLNECATIGGLLTALLDDAAGLDLLIAVADGGSTDGAQDIVARIASNEPRVRLMENPKRIQSAASLLPCGNWAKAGAGWCASMHMPRIPRGTSSA